MSLLTDWRLRTWSIAASQALDPDHGFCCLSGQTRGSEQCSVSVAAFSVTGQMFRNVDLFLSYLCRPATQNKNVFVNVSPLPGLTPRPVSAYPLTGQTQNDTPVTSQLWRLRTRSVCWKGTFIPLRCSSPILQSRAVVGCWHQRGDTQCGPPFFSLNLICIKHTVGSL